MSEWVQKKKEKYQGSKNKEATDPWSAKCVNSQLHVKTHAEAVYEAWDLTGLGAKINTKAKIWKSLAIESNNILRGEKSSPAIRALSLAGTGVEIKVKHNSGLFLTNHNI